MEKVLLAIGFRQLEEYLQRQLRKEFIFVGSTVYREGVIRSIGQKNPDIVVLRETLEGKENILSIVYEIRNKFPKVRVIFLAGKRSPGDELLSTLVNYGVYDILYGEKIHSEEIIRLMREPNEYKDVLHLQPKPMLDESRNKVLFSSPDNIVKEVIKEVYIEKEPSDDKEEDKRSKKEKNSRKEENPLKENIPSDKEKQITKEKSKEEKSSKEKKSPKEKDSSKKEPHEKTSVLSSISSKSNKVKKKTFFTERESPEEIEDTLFNLPPITMGKEKIITFMGGKHGVGNTTNAINIAFLLAKQKNKVIFLELNDRIPAVAYWYELGYVEEGIDKALIALEKQDFDSIEKAIVHSQDLKTKNSPLKKNYEKFPDTLDFMFFSKTYLTRNNEDNLFINEAFSKELYLYLLFQLNYDYIILDIPCGIWDRKSINALIYSNKVFITINQDVCCIGNTLYLINELEKDKIHVKKKTHFILSRYEKAQLDIKDIKNWMEIDELFTVPSSSKELINANFVGLPIVLGSRNSNLKNAYEKILKVIT